MKLNSVQLRATKVDKHPHIYKYHFIFISILENIYEYMYLHLYIYINIEIKHLHWSSKKTLILFCAPRAPIENHVTQLDSGETLGGGKDRVAECGRW